MNIHSVYLSFLFIFSSSLIAQKPSGELQLEYLRQHYKELIFLQEGCEITSDYLDSATGIRHIYFSQTINGHPIENATASLHLTKEHKIAHVEERFILGANKIITTDQRKLPVSKLIIQLLKEKYESYGDIQIIQRNQDNHLIYKVKNNITSENEIIDVKPSYYFDSVSQKIAPSYTVFWTRNKNSEWLKMAIDGVSGNKIYEVNLLNSCSFNSGDFIGVPRVVPLINENLAQVGSSCYQVYPIPTESPIHGNRKLEMGPWLKAPDASPFGWHGDGFNFYYSTRGNNTDTYEDSDDDDMPTGGDLSRAYGGYNLNFDFSYDPLLPPFNNKDAAVTNLFYWTNLMHDVWYKYGFHEQAGNFQMNNFNKGGIGNDPVLAQGLDNVYYARNNATFGTPPDGMSGIMQIFLWQFPIRDTIIIESPPSIAGKYQFVHSPVTPPFYAPLSRQIVMIQDNSGYPGFGCSNLTNAALLNGKIAMVDRGLCSFTSKMSRIQSAGAVAVIVCNNEDTEISGIGGWSYGLSIPAVMMSKKDCQRIKLYLNGSVSATMFPNSALKFTVQQQSYIFSRANFGKSISNLNAPLVQVADNSNNTKDACDFITNGFELYGKIALIDDGICEPSYKVMQVQNYGAVAAVICKQGNGYPDTMPSGSFGHLITIPVIQISQADCQSIRIKLPVNGQLRNIAPALVDGCFDAGIICHEYGHGISNRLTGGPNNVSCLSNAEQMGEGWSDYFGLVMTIAPGDHAFKKRGMGTFSSSQGITGNGVRPYPYHVSLAVNPADYNMVDDVTSISQPHGIGYVWCSMIWDLMWAFVKKYGLDSDIYNLSSTKGNIKVNKLILEGMKLQPCSPGFVDARNAILKADTLLYGGANACLIWNVFARRGLGYYASQGSPFSRTDGFPDYSIPSGCSYMNESQLFEETLLSSQYIELFAIPESEKIKLVWRFESDLQNVQISLNKRQDRAIDPEAIQLSVEEFKGLNFSDAQVLPDVNYYYQITITNKSGKQIQSNWVQSRLNSSNSNWLIYPNPVFDHCILKAPRILTDQIFVRIFDAQLRLVDQFEHYMKNEQELQLDFSDIKKGAYYISVKTSTGTQTLKTIKY